MHISLVQELLVVFIEIEHRVLIVNQYPALPILEPDIPRVVPGHEHYWSVAELLDVLAAATVQSGPAQSVAGFADVGGFDFGRRTGFRAVGRGGLARGLDLGPAGLAFALGDHWWWRCRRAVTSWIGQGAEVRVLATE